MGVDLRSAPGSQVTGVTVAVPGGWHLLPPATALGRAGDGGGEEWVPLLRPAVADLAREAAETAVLLCAFRTLGDVGAGLVLAVRHGYPVGELSAQAERLAADDPGTQATEELCWLELAGPAGRLAWTPRAAADGRRAACVAYHVPFPGDDDRVAVVTCSAVGADPGQAVYAELDALAATVCFTTGPEPASHPGGAR